MPAPDKPESDFEREMRERIEREITQKRVRPEATAPATVTPATVTPPPAAAAPAPAAPAPAEPAPAAAPAPAAPAAGTDSRTAMEDEIRRRIEAEVQNRLRKEPAAPSADAPATSAPAAAPSPSPAAEATADAGAEADAGKKGDTPGKRPGAKGTKGGKGGKSEILPKARSAKPKSSSMVGGGSTTRAKGGDQKSTMSDRDRILIEEKAKIDQKLKRRTWMLYPLVTIVCGIGFLLYLKFGKEHLAAWLHRNDPPMVPEVEIIYETVEQPSNGGSQAATPKVDTLAKVLAESKAMAADGNYQEAIEKLKTHAQENATDAGAANDAIDDLRALYLKSGLASAELTSLTSQAESAIADGKVSALQSVIDDLVSFQASNPNEQFAVEPVLASAAAAYFQVSGKFAEFKDATVAGLGYAEPPWKSDTEWRIKLDKADAYGADDIEIEGGGTGRSNLKFDF